MSPGALRLQPLRFGTSSRARLLTPTTGESYKGAPDWHWRTRRSAASTASTRFAGALKGEPRIPSA
eukprot:scaffold2544_cov245-Pinguiococcus_pyrenoidosus.AAC.2